MWAWRLFTRYAVRGLGKVAEIQPLTDMSPLALDTLSSLGSTMQMQINLPTWMAANLAEAPFICGMQMTVWRGQWRHSREVLVSELDTKTFHHCLYHLDKTWGTGHRKNAREPRIPSGSWKGDQVAFSQLLTPLECAPHGILLRGIAGSGLENSASRKLLLTEQQGTTEMPFSNVTFLTIMHRLPTKMPRWVSSQNLLDKQNHLVTWYFEFIRWAFNNNHSCKNPRTYWVLGAGPGTVLNPEASKINKTQSLIMSTVIYFLIPLTQSFSSGVCVICMWQWIIFKWSIFKKLQGRIQTVIWFKLDNVLEEDYQDVGTKCPAREERFNLFLEGDVLLLLIIV